MSVKERLIRWGKRASVSARPWMAKASALPPRFCDPDAGWLSPELFSASYGGKADFLVFKSSVKEIGFDKDYPGREKRGFRLRVWFDGASEWESVFFTEGEIIQGAGGCGREMLDLVRWQASHGISLGVRDGSAAWIAKDKSSARLAPYHPGLGDVEMIVFARWLGESMLSQRALRERFGRSVEREASLRIRFPPERIDSARVIEEKEDLGRSAPSSKTAGASVKKRL